MDRIGTDASVDAFGSPEASASPDREFLEAVERALEQARIGNVRPWREVFAENGWRTA